MTNFRNEYTKQFYVQRFSSYKKNTHRTLPNIRTFRFNAKYRSDLWERNITHQVKDQIKQSLFNFRRLFLSGNLLIHDLVIMFAFSRKRIRAYSW
jgi:hypothetical protein